MKFKFPGWGTTATGTVIGFAIGGPIGAPIGAAAGGIVDWVRHKRKHTILPTLVAIQNVSSAPPAVINAAAAAAQKSIPNEATFLHGYMRKAKKLVWSDPLSMVHIRNFQAAFLRDPNASALGIKVTPNGLFDLPTSAALTFYTHDPIPPDPSVLIKGFGTGGGGGGGPSVSVQPSVGVSSSGVSAGIGGSASGGGVSGGGSFSL